MTKKLVLYYILFVINFSLFSQQKKSYIGMEYMPTIATQLSPSIEQNNPLRFSSSLGIHLNHELVRNKVYIEYGLYSIDRGHGYKVEVFNQNGVIFGQYRKTEHNLCLSVPLKIGFKFNDLFVELGPSFDYIYAKRIKHDKNLIDKSIPTGTNRILFGANLAFGINIVPKYNKGFMFSVGGYSNLTLTPMYLNAGLKLGVKIRLK